MDALLSHTQLASAHHGIYQAAPHAYKSSLELEVALAAEQISCPRITKVIGGFAFTKLPDKGVWTIPLPAPHNSP